MHRQGSSSSKHFSLFLDGPSSRSRVANPLPSPHILPPLRREMRNLSLWLQLFSHHSYLRSLACEYALLFAPSLRFLIAGLSLYTRSIRYALARFVSQPNDSVSLNTMTSGIKLAATSPIFNVRRIEWTIGAVICTLAVNAQTAG